MNTIISVNYYYAIFSYLTLITVVIVSFFSFSKLDNVVASLKNPSKELELLGYCYFIIVLLFLGLRPISYAFGDMGTYYKHFVNYQLGYPLKEGDILFEMLMYGSAHLLNASIFFFICFCLHFFPILWASKRSFLKFWPLVFLFTISNYDYYGYAVNGLRQGIAASIFLLALTFKGWRSVLLILIAIGFHKTYALPALAVFIFMFNRNPLHYLIGWFVCLLITVTYSGFSDLISSIGLFKEDLDTYTNFDGWELDQFSQVGFRWDFIAYNALPIAVGSYFIFKQKVSDSFYTRLYCVYITCSAFWLLMIHTLASNRIAYLSWFLAGFMIAYPFVHFYINKKQNKIFSGLLFCFYLFTFVAN